MPNLLILAEDVFELFGVMAVKRVRKLFCGKNKHFSNYHVTFAAYSISIVVCYFR